MSSVCQRCQSQRVASIVGKCSDCFSADIPADGIDSYQGYALRIEDICGGDYIELEVCLDCGQVQGKFPKEKVTPDE